MSNLKKDLTEDLQPTDEQAADLQGGTGEAAANARQQAKRSADTDSRVAGARRTERQV